MPTFGTAQLKLLERLTNVIAVSGDEGEVRKIVLEEIKPFVDDVRVDALGNVLAIRSGRGAKRVRVLVDAHMDEVGFMIVADDGEGLYRFETVGGIDVRHLVGKQVYVGKDRTPVIIGGKPIHLMDHDEYTRKVLIDGLRIDLGHTGKGKVGDRAGFATQYKRVGPSIMAKSIDDRIGIATLIELVKNAPPNIDLCAAFTVQEEIGLRGAKVAVQYFDPGMGIAVDSTPANDLPAYDGSENISYNNWNDWASTTLCVKSLLDNGVPEERVLIVDNASTDGSPAFLRRELPAVPLVVSPQNLGFAAGMNFGARQILEKCADEDAIIFVNNDALIVGGMQALKEALSRKSVGLVSPVILHKDRSEHVHFQGSDYDWNKAEIIFYDKHLGARRESDGLIDSPRVVGAAVAVRVDFIRQVGLFDESLFMYYEDDELSVRALRAGYRNVGSRGRVARQRSAKPRTAVRLRS